MIRNGGTRVGATLCRSSSHPPVIRTLSSRASTVSPIASHSSLSLSSSALRLSSAPSISLRSSAAPSFSTKAAPPRFRETSAFLSQDGLRPPWLGSRTWPIFNLAGPVWRRSAHSSAKRTEAVISKRNKSSVSGGSQKHANGFTSKPESLPNTSPPKAPQQPPIDPSSSNKHLLDRLPHLPHIPRNLHRPTKDELLAAATGFWSRLRVRFKWFSIREFRRFNLDDISAFISWIFIGHLVWILVGTTTFVSLAILVINTGSGQETVAKWIGNYLTQSSGVKVVFESAVVPKWKDGVISFKNVFVSRRPGQGQGHNVTKGSSTSAAAAAAAAALAERAEGGEKIEEEDTNYTQFDVSVDTVNVTLSFARWFNGKGLLRDVEMKGIRGVLDRTSVHPLDHWVDPKSYRHEHTPGDFELESFKLEDLLITVYQPDNFRPFSVSIYSCDLPQLRKQWLFYDFLSANMVSGSYDNSLFTIHPRQTHNYTGAQLNQGIESEDGSSQWKKHTRLRIDGLSIDHLNRAAEGPFSWIHEGNVDIVADIMFPADDSDSIAKVMSDFYDRVEATVTSNSFNGADRQPAPANAPTTPHPTEPQTSTQPAEPPVESTPAKNEDDDRFLVMDLRVHLNDVRSAIPLFTRDISYVNNALIRPIVAYINSKKAFIPVNCRVVKRRSEFDGSWTIYDSGLMDDLSREMYDAFVRDITSDDQARRRRFKKVGIWTLQLAAQALFIGLAGNIA